MINIMLVSLPSIGGNVSNHAWSDTVLTYMLAGYFVIKKSEEKKNKIRGNQVFRPDWLGSRIGHSLAEK
jgi:hypothetical protein